MTTISKPVPARRAAWTAPERPAWVTAANRLVGQLDLRTLVPLDAGSMIAAATGATGLSNFGA